jgi:hypothetical protein
MAENASQRSEDYERTERKRQALQERGVDFRAISDNKKKTYYREFKKVVEARSVEFDSYSNTMRHLSF